MRRRGTRKTSNISNIKSLHIGRHIGCVPTEPLTIVVDDVDVLSRIQQLLKLELLPDCKAIVIHHHEEGYVCEVLYLIVNDVIHYDVELLTDVRPYN